MRLYQVLALLGAAFVLFVGCQGEDLVESNAVPVSKSVPVRTVSVEPRAFSTYLEVTGTLRAQSHIQLIVEEPGTVREILVKKGDLVEAGATLAVLENRVSQATFSQARAALRQAELDQNSKKLLYEKKAISENDYLGSTYSREASQAAYELARARVDKLQIVAPIEGYVNERYYDVGAYASPGTPIFEVINSDVLRVRVGVAERFLGDIRIGTPVEITFDAYDDLTITDTVDFVSRSIDPESRTFQVEIEIGNPGGLLAPQMVADVKILRRTYQEAIVVPLDALVESESGWYVFVESGGLAAQIPVRRIAVYEDSVVVEGLFEAQKLVVAGQQGLSDGDEVTIAGT